MRTDDEQRVAVASTWISVAVNLVLVTAQILVGLVARSQALVADGLHSASDIIADLIVLTAARHGNAAADDDHPYGHMRFENFASLLLGLILIATGVGMAFSAAARLADGAALGAVHPAALAIALLTLVCKEALFRYMRRIGERLRSSMLVANAYHARADAASSFVVAIGIGANLAGVHAMDAIAAAIVGFMVARSGWQFSWAAFHDLTDHALSQEEIAAIERTVLGVEGVRGMHELRTRRMGDWAAIDVHVLVDSRLSVSEGHLIAERVRAAVRAEHRVIEAVVHIDPSDANQVARLLKRPTREALLRALRHELPEAKLERHVLRLHYLDTGVEVELELAGDASNEECEQIEHAVKHLTTEFGGHVVVVRVSQVTGAQRAPAITDDPALNDS